MSENNQVQDSGYMPKRGVYIAWMIVGFATGLLWGLLSIGPMKRMNVAINDGDSYTAWANAKKIRMFALIGIGINVVLILFQLLGNR